MTMVAALGEVMVYEDDLRWYCIRTGPKKERMAGQLLEIEVGIETFCPMMRYEKLRRSGKAWVVEAMFPGYVFGRFREASQRRHVLSISGVTKLVQFAGRPAVVDDWIVEELRSLISENQTVEVRANVSVGDQVRIVDGVYRGFEVLVTRVLSPTRRIAILMDVLGGEREVEIDIERVLPELAHPLQRD